MWELLTHLRQSSPHPSLTGNLSKLSPQLLNLQAEGDSPASSSVVDIGTCDLSESSKLSCLRTMLDEILQAGEKAVVVSTSTRMLDIAERLCQEAGTTTGRIDGSTAAPLRQGLVDAFNSASGTLKVSPLSLFWHTDCP
jgi:SNF2 family DNA or RNA helicase